MLPLLPQDAANKRPPFKAPFSSMAPDLARIIRGHVVDSGGWHGGVRLLPLLLLALPRCCQLFVNCIPTATR